MKGKEPKIEYVEIEVEEQSLCRTLLFLSLFLHKFVLVFLLRIISFKLLKALFLQLHNLRAFQSRVCIFKRYFIRKVADEKCKGYKTSKSNYICDTYKFDRVKEQKG